MDKDLQYYLDNPDETPSDPVVLAQLLTQINGDTEAAEVTEEDVKTEDAPVITAPSGEADKAIQEAKDPAAEGEEAPIATRDGKSTIPYDVLKTERERRQAAEGTVKELAGRLEQIEAQLAKGTQQGDQQAAKTAEAAIEGLEPKELDALREDFPQFGKVIDKLLGRIDGLSEQVVTLSQREGVRQVTERNTTATTVQEFIDNEPILVHLQATNPALFAKAVELDRLLLQDTPDMAARFKEVATFMDMKFGPFEGVKQAQDPEPATPSISKEAARKEVEKQIKAKPATPRSLSDLPSGEPPATNEQAELESMSAAEIGAKMLSMSPAQRANFLNRL